MSYAKIDDIWADLCAGLVLDQYKDATNLKGLIKVFVGAGQGQAFENVGQAFENAADRLRAFWDLSRAEGAVLDLIGKVRGLTRKASEGDTSFSQRIAQDLQIQKAGTPEYVIERAKILSGDASPVYFEEANPKGAPVVFVYAKNGRQLKRSDVNALTPAGVLGVPGVVIKAANGKKIMAGSVETFALTDGEGAPLTDGDGVALTGRIGYKKALIAVGKNSAIGNV